MQLTRFVILGAFCCVVPSVESASVKKGPPGRKAAPLRYEGLELIGELKKKAGEGPEGRHGGQGTAGEPTITKYYVSAEKAKWADAGKLCKKATKCQGHLVRIRDAEEDEAVQSYIPAAKYGQYLWTDGQLSDKTGAGWTWGGETGAKMSYVHEGFETTAHLAVMSTSEAQFQWYARSDPEEQAYFICQVSEGAGGATAQNSCGA